VIFGAIALTDNSMSFPLVVWMDINVVDIIRNETPNAGPFRIKSAILALNSLLNSPISKDNTTSLYPSTGLLIALRESISESFRPCTTFCTA
jgi:hypothetical protein